MAATRPSARIEAAFSAVSLNTTTILAKFNPPPAQASAAKPNPATYSLASVPQPRAEDEPRNTIAPNLLVAAAFKAAWPDALSTSADQAELSHGRVLAYADATGSIPPIRDDAPALPNIHTSRAPAPTGQPAPSGSTAWANQELPYLKYYVYSETAAAGEAGRDRLGGIERRSARNAGPGDRTRGRCIRSRREFHEGGRQNRIRFQSQEPHRLLYRPVPAEQVEFSNSARSGDILNPRDNAMAAAYKFVNEAALFEVRDAQEADVSPISI